MIPALLKLARRTLAAGGRTHFGSRGHVSVQSPRIGAGKRRRPDLRYVHRWRVHSQVILLGEEITLAKSVGVVAAIQRSAVRNAAAAASGASTMLARLRAQSDSSGGQGEAGSTMADYDLATP